VIVRIHAVRVVAWIEIIFVLLALEVFLDVVEVGRICALEKREGGRGVGKG